MPYVASWSNALRTLSFWSLVQDIPNRQEKQQVNADLDAIEWATGNIIFLASPWLCVKGRWLFTPAIGYRATSKCLYVPPIGVIDLFLDHR